MSVDYKLLAVFVVRRYSMLGTADENGERIYLTDTEPCGIETVEAFCGKAL